MPITQVGTPAVLNEGGSGSPDSTTYQVSKSVTGGNSLTLAIGGLANDRLAGPGHGGCGYRNLVGGRRLQRRWCHIRANRSGSSGRPALGSRVPARKWVVVNGQTSIFGIRRTAGGHLSRDRLSSSFSMRARRSSITPQICSSVTRRSRTAVDQSGLRSTFTSCRFAVSRKALTIVRKDPYPILREFTRTSNKNPLMQGLVSLAAGNRRCDVPSSSVISRWGWVTRG
jgi:hypothetical protein